MHTHQFSYDTRYRPEKSSRPALIRCSLRGKELVREHVAIPRVGTGTKIVRLMGRYEAADGDVFVEFDRGYAEIFVVHQGFRFALWWGESEAVSAQDRWLAAFLRKESLGYLQALSPLRQQLEFIRVSGLGRPGEQAALTDLIAGVREVIQAGDRSYPQM